MKLSALWTLRKSAMRTLALDVHYLVNNVQRLCLPKKKKSTYYMFLGVMLYT